MTSEKNIPCGPCLFDDVTKDAGKWCTNCEEGICEDCENVHRKSKTSRNHKVISIEDYRKIENVSISQVCEHHGENLEWFCKNHDEVLCVVCVPSNHKACSAVIPISVNSANSRQSTALSDLEESIDGTLSNLKQCIKNRESAPNEIENQEITVKTMILETRMNINHHLDRLQEKCLHELRLTSQTCISKYMEIVQKLKSKEELLTELREQTIHMKQFSSDIQVFLRTLQMNKRIEREIKSIKSELCSAKDYKLKVAFHTLIEKLNEAEEFGKINVSECATMLEFREQKIDQSQIMINASKPNNVSHIKLNLSKKFQIKKTKGMKINVCAILPNGHLLMANGTKENHLNVYRDTGEHIRDILVSGKPYDIAVIDLNRIVVTYWNAFYLEVMINNTFNVEKNISLQNSCFEVSHGDGRLYVVYENDIQVMDLSGRQLKTLKTAANGLACIKTSRDKIFYADNSTNQVHCCRLNGEELWKFECDLIELPHDITVDSYQNVYVVGYNSNNLTIIQHDGKYSKTLLIEADGLYHPTAVDFDTDKRTLLICNEEGNVTLYKVV
ncbi:Hypothetical predicted protein [Mytilus galloprovincialis]|uniref:B box-type domain-containing protein n=1 Tax=Mytilus galloprovincialis TaxID=29158 RepID=A0A8B6EC21_MYTGA|nr:Hypothetical predicted protein [Mytilus galloprovincialis]